MRKQKLERVVLVCAFLLAGLLAAVGPRNLGTTAAAQDNGKIERPTDTRVTQEQRQAAADRAKAAGLETGPEFTAAAAAAGIGPGDTPDYFGMPNYANSPLPEVTAVPPAPAPPVTSTVFYFAEGTCRPDFDPYICIQNPGDTAADVTITYMKGDATTASEQLSVPPNSRATALPRNTLGTGEDLAHDFSARVECTNGQQIVAERPMYFNYRGAWTGGHDVVGLPENPVVPPTERVVPGTGMRKFVDTLPGLGSANANNLGQYIPVAVPDRTTYPGSDYYEIELGEYTEQMHSDLPPTKLRGYRQTNTADPGVSVFNYLGPMIVSQRDRPVRVKFTNNLPTGAGGDLFLPVDTTMMGAGMGPNMAMPHHAMQVGGPGRPSRS